MQIFLTFCVSYTFWGVKIWMRAQIIWVRIAGEELTVAVLCLQALASKFGAFKMHNVHYTVIYRGIGYLHSVLSFYFWMQIFLTFCVSYTFWGVKIWMRARIIWVRIARQGTSSQYQNSYLDLVVWCSICQLNKNISKYWDGNAI